MGKGSQVTLFIEEAVILGHCLGQLQQSTVQFSYNRNALHYFPWMAEFYSFFFIYFALMSLCFRQSC